MSEPHDRVRVWRSAPMAIAAGLSGVWLAAAAAALWFLGGDGGMWLAIAVTLAMPLVVIWMAALLAVQAVLNRRETDRALAAAAAAAYPPGNERSRTAKALSVKAAAGPPRDARSHPERGPEPGPQAGPQPGPARVSPRAPSHASSSASSAATGRAAKAAAVPRQDRLPFPPVETADLLLTDLIRALDFPESLNDAEGFRALRRALRDPRAGRLVQASQDVLTLLGDDDLYMDDFVPGRAPADAWRSLAAGERSDATAAAGALRDEAALGTVGTRLRSDPVFRDAAHHFLRLFDHELAHVAPRASDDELAALADTRTGRAFMLIGRAVGMFG